MIDSEIFSSWIAVVAASVVVATFSLGASMLTLLHGHLRGLGIARSRQNYLSRFYIFGFVLALVAGLLGASAISAEFDLARSEIAWEIIAFLSLVAGFFVVLFYYRPGRDSGTRLWLPRHAAEYLYRRTRATSSAFEAFMLGVAAVVAELVLIAAPLAIVANLLPTFDKISQIFVTTIFVVFASLPLVVLAIAAARNAKLSRFVRFRDKNKRFLQAFSGLCLIVLSAFLLAYRI